VLSDEASGASGTPAYLVRMDECCAPPPLNLGGSKRQDDAIAVCSGRCWRLTLQCSRWSRRWPCRRIGGAQADALDFFGDAANYAISLLVVGMALRYRPRLLWRRARRWLPLAYGLSGR